MTDSWVGGDIDGLAAMGTALTSAKEHLDDIVKPLSKGVDKLVKDAGWKGEAAEKFEAAWTKDAITAGGFAELVYAVGKELTDLATNLSSANTALQNAAHVAQKKGVSIGPKGEPVPLATNNPPSAKEVQATKDNNDYTTLYTELMHQAQRARLLAAKNIGRLYAEIDPSEPMQKGDKIVVADYLRGLWTAGAEGDRALGLDMADDIKHAQEEHDKALSALKDEEAKFRTADANLPKAFKLRGEWQAAADQLDSLEGRLAGLENGSSHMPYDRYLNYKMADVLRGSELAEGAPRFLKEIPVIDVAATVAAGGLEAKQDHDEGWSWGHSVLVDVGGGLVALGAGVALAASVPVDGVVATAAVGGAVVVGVGTFADKLFHEHWSEDWDDHGAVVGTLYGIGHSGAQAWHTGEGMVTGTGHWISDKSKALWHKIF
ncbi:WXG100 family type VII secretion target [Streptomyces sp. NPDC003233]